MISTVGCKDGIVAGVVATLEARGAQVRDAFAPITEREGERPESGTGCASIPRTTMTTRIDEAPSKVHHREVLSQKHAERAAREEKSEVKAEITFSEADPASKPLVPFEATPVRAAPPPTW